AAAKCCYCPTSFVSAEPTASVFFSSTFFESLFTSAVAVLAAASAFTDQTHSVPPRSLTKNTRLSTDQNGERFVPIPSVSRCRLLPSALIVQMSCCACDLVPPA